MNSVIIYLKLWRLRTIYIYLTRSPYIIIHANLSSPCWVQSSPYFAHCSEQFTNHYNIYHCCGKLKNRQAYHSWQFAERSLTVLINTFYIKRWQFIGCPLKIPIKVSIIFEMLDIWATQTYTVFYFSLILLRLIGVGSENTQVTITVIKVQD